MSVHYHSANVKCLSREQIVHLRYYTNSLFEDDLHQSSTRQFCHHHDPYHDRLSKFAVNPCSRREHRCIRKNGRKSNSHLPVLSAEDTYSSEFWASAIDRMVLDFCCAMVDRQYYDAALPSGASMADEQAVEPSQFDSHRRQRCAQPSSRLGPATDLIST